MYECPINIIMNDIVTQFEQRVLKAVQRCGIYVDKDELIKALDYDRKQYEKGYADAKAEQRWIPCSEHMPKKSGQYYVSGGGKVWIYEFLIIPNFFSGGWCNDVANPKVQAWMPLPEPYKGGEQND